MAKKTTDLETQTVTFDFGDGRVETFKLSDCSDAMKIQLALHGGSQKVGDSYASAKKVCADTDIDPTEWSQSQAHGVIAQIYEDDWTVRTPGAGAVTDLATALAEAVECEVSAAVERLADESKEGRAELRKHPKIKAILDRIKLDRQKKKAAASAKAAKSDDVPDLAEFTPAA